MQAQTKKGADAAKGEALSSNAAKGKFLAHMSHEICTPIGNFESRVCRTAEIYDDQARVYAPEAKILVVDHNKCCRWL